MLAVADHIPWAIQSVLFGRDVDIMTKLHGDICMNAPSQAYIYVPWRCSYSGGIVTISLSKYFALYHATYTQYM